MLSTCGQMVESAGEMCGSMRVVGGNLKCVVERSDKSCGSEKGGWVLEHGDLLTVYEILKEKTACEIMITSTPIRNTLMISWSTLKDIPVREDL